MTQNFGSSSAPVSTNWQKKSLLALGRFMQGTGFPEKYQGIQDESLPFYKVSDFNLPGNAKYLVEHNNAVSERICQRINGTTIPKQSIVFAKVGAALLLNRRRITTRQCLIDNNCAAIVPNADINLEFLFQLLCSIDFANYVQSGAVPSINQKVLDNILVFVPPPAEQSAIAAVLATVDRAIEQTEALIAKYQRIKTGLMQDLLTRGIDEHGNLRDPATHKFKDSPLGRIPEEWEVKPLEYHLSYISYGFTNPMPEAAEGPYLVTAANIANGVVDYNSCRHTTQSAFDNLLTRKSKPIKNDILLTKDGSLGRLALVGDYTLCINQSVAVLRTNQRIESDFLKMLLETPIHQSRLLGDSGGSTIKHLYISRVDKMLIATPSSLKEREGIKKLIQSMATFLTGYENQLTKLHRLKTGLMQDLLTGKVSVESLLS